ncbi:caspase family protein [Calothrix sp. CCY 0018]|uniref:caspase family protein n=1 Tax=Calothrix sp. CCY 0018 TaxID=3103864 RepID=UPI0039C6C530
MAKIALLIGVSEYQPGLNPLPAAVKDVEAMREVLVNTEMGDFNDADVTVLKNPQPQDIRNAIYDLFAHRRKDDLLLFYFSGHGIKDDRGNLYFSTCDTRKDNGKLVTPSAVAARTLHDSINDSRSQRQVIILDCCFSGAIAQGMSVKDDGSVNVQEQLGGKGRAILTSSTSTQYSFEQQGSELSTYTRYLVEGIDTGVADKDADGWISIDELHDYAKCKVQETSPAMTPEFYPVKEGHKILLAKSPKDDPKLVYRQEVESRAQESQGAFSIFALRILEGKRQELNISPEEANAIKEEVLQPYREYERKRYEYEQTLIEAAKKHYPFSQVIEKEIKEYQQYLGLKDEDIAVIEKRVFAPKQAEYEQQQEEERLKREQERAEYQEQLRQQQEQEAQQRLQREQEEAQRSSQEYKYKVRRYKEEFVQAVEAKYPLNESVRNQLKDFQQFLGLSDEDIAQIEKPILDEKEVEYREKLQIRQRQQDQNESPRTKRQQYQEHLRERPKLRQQKQYNKQEKQQQIVGFIVGALLTYILTWSLVLFGIIDDQTSIEVMSSYVIGGGCLGGLVVCQIQR